MGPADPAQVGPIRAWTRSALRDLLYVGAVSVWSVVTFTVLVAGFTVTASVLPLVLGLFVWIGFVLLVRHTTWVDRKLAGWQRREEVPAVYRSPVGPGLIPLLRTLTTDPQTWRELAWLGLTSLVGFASGLAILIAACVVAAYVSVPAWYWAVEPEAHKGLTNLGFVTIDTVVEALAVAGLGLALVPVVLVGARGYAVAHGALAVRLLARTGRPR